MRRPASCRRLSAGTLLASTRSTCLEEYGGQGADLVATCIVTEEVARADASASLIPAVNKLIPWAPDAADGSRRAEEAQEGAARPGSRTA